MFRRGIRMPVLLAGCVVLGGCALLFGGRERPPAHSTFILDHPATVTVHPGAACGTLLLARPNAASGFNGTSMVYIEQDHRLDYFAWSTWADPPARMLLPILERGLGRSGLFVTVAAAPAPLRADLRLETGQIALYQAFDGAASHAVLEANVRLVDVATRSLLGIQAFRIEEPAAEATPYGGVVAGNRAVARLIEEMIAFAGPLRPLCQTPE